jgi:DNA repair exonuclease SbcCD ATPase subunit
MGELSQEDLENFLGFDHTTFLYTSLMGQFNTFFFDLEAAEQMRVFSDALDLSGWLELSKRARAKEKKTKEEIEYKRVECAGEEGTLKGLLEQREAFNKLYKEFEAEKEKRIELLAKKLRKEVKRLGVQKKEIEEEDDRLARYKHDKDVLEDKILKGHDHIGSFRKKKEALDEKRNVLIGSLKEVNREIKESKAMKGTCPLCQQKIDKELLSSLNEKRAKKAMKFSYDVDEVNGKIGKIVQDVKVLEERLFHDDEKLTAVEEYIENCKDHLQKLRGSHSQTKKEKASLSKELEELQAKGNPHEERLNATKKKVREKKAEIAKRKKKLDSLEKERQAYELWATWFKNLRLWIIDKALIDLEVCVNNSLITLGLEGWKVEFSVERELESGKTSKGFTTLISHPDSDKPMPWKGWSGGETQRLRVAGAVGLSELLSSRKGINLDLEIWDEPTAHLSGEGVDDLLDFLAERAETLRKRIWIIDHRSLSYGGFKGKAVIVKKESGVYVEQEAA